MLERAKADHEFVKNSALSAATVAEDEKRKLAEKIDEMGDDELDALGTNLLCLFCTRPFTPPLFDGKDLKHALSYLSLMVALRKLMTSNALFCFSQKSPALTLSSRLI